MDNNNNMDREETREKIMNWSKKVSESFILSARAYYLYHNMEKEQEIERTIEDLYNNPHSKCYLYTAKRLYENLFIVKCFDTRANKEIYTYHIEGTDKPTLTFYTTIEEAILNGIYAKFHKGKNDNNAGYYAGKILDVVEEGN